MTPVLMAPVRAMSVPELQEKMRESDSTLTGLEFQYVQVMTSALSSETQRSSGVAYFSKPRSLRVEQKEPENQLVVASGKNVFIYTPRFNQVLKDSWDRWFKRNSFFPGLMGFQETVDRLKKQYEWKILGHFDLNGESTVNIRLKKPSGDREELNLWLGASDYLPRKTEVILGTLKVTTTLVSLRRNPDLDPDLFDFKGPPDAEFIKVP